MNKRNSSGFTMVELLAAIVIMGILSTIAISAVMALINNSRNIQMEQQKKAIILATKAYLNDNTSAKPKEENSQKEISVIVLRDNGYLKKDVKNNDGQSCMSSVVIVTKKEKDYQYTVNLVCD